MNEMNVLIAAPMLDDSAGFRTRAQATSLWARFVLDGELCDEKIDVLVVDDHWDSEGRQFPNLKTVLSLSVGVERLLASADLAHARVVRLLTREHQQLMREYVLYHLLRSNRQFLTAEQLQQAHRWEWQSPSRPLAGRRALVLGSGFLGGATAAALQDFGLSVITWSRTARPGDGVPSISGEEALADALDDADFLICLLPLTPATRGILGAGHLRRLPRRAVLVNVSRAECIDLSALRCMLHEGSIAGAVLDVFPIEPLADDSPFWAVPNLTVTPHLAATPAPETYLPVLAEALYAIREGHDLRHAVDRNRGY
jgi:glyoxylate/hydroxypyruvate reductase A